MTTPNEKSTAVVTIAPTDEDGTTLSFVDLITPQWQLMKPDGTIINNRSFANCAMTSLSIVLSGDDLACVAGESAQRVLAIQFSYNSSSGNGLLCKVEETFSIQDLVSQS